MLWKRASSRYGDTPEPVTPYQRAAQAWDDRIGSARVQAANWRLAALGAIALAFVLAGGLVWRSTQSFVTPYVVELTSDGAVRAVGPAEGHYEPTDAQIAFHLADFVTNTRSVSIDPVVVRQNWLKAYAYATDRAAATLNDYARDNDPFADVGHRSVSVDVTRPAMPEPCVPIRSDSTSTASTGRKTINRRSAHETPCPHPSRCQLPCRLRNISRHWRSAGHRP